MLSVRIRIWCFRIFGFILATGGMFTFFNDENEDAVPMLITGILFLFTSYHLKRKYEL